ncbi:MAG: hypothetical protein L6R36_000361 [Xanthoria steineri]|nr:MAG: hypothetical protein L6R36_000361 [Xanthoria steineri]
MSTLFSTSPLRHSHSEALTTSQQAGKYIQQNSFSSTPIPIPFLSTPESTELWSTYENLLYSCLRTGDDKAAHSCLEKLGGRFGTNDERIMGLRGLYQEAMAEDQAALLRMLREYDQILAENPTVTPVRKRRITLLRSLSRESDAINGLIDLLEASPTDIESWAELCELYVSQGLYQQAEFCLEEILLSTPNAWNVHARLGEILYTSASTTPDQLGTLAESVRRFCRSIELCNGYVRGYYGLKLASDRLLGTLSNSGKADSQTSNNSRNHELAVPSVEVLQKLNESAISMLGEIARKARLDDPRSPDIAFVEALLKA